MKVILEFSRRTNTVSAHERMMRLAVIQVVIKRFGKCRESQVDSDCLKLSLIIVVVHSDPIFRGPDWPASIIIELMESTLAITQVSTTSPSITNMSTKNHHPPMSPQGLRITTPECFFKEGPWPCAIESLCRTSPTSV